MKTKVKVTMKAETVVEMEVEHHPDEDPTDLHKEDKMAAKTASYRHLPEWKIQKVEKA